MNDIPVEIDAPKSNHEHNKTCNYTYCQPPTNLKDTMKKWIRDPNGWIALFTIIIVIIGYRTYRISEDTAKRQLRAYVVPDSIILQKSIKEGTPITLKLIVYNMGQSPAYKVSQACIFRIAQIPKEYSSTEFLKDTHRGIAILGSSNKPISFDNVSTTISDKEIGDVISQKYKLFYSYSRFEHQKPRMTNFAPRFS